MTGYETINMMRGQRPSGDLVYFVVEPCKDCGSELHQTIWAQKEAVDFSKSMGNDETMMLYSSWECKKCGSWYEMAQAEEVEGE